MGGGGAKADSLAQWRQTGASNYTGEGVFLYVVDSGPNEAPILSRQSVSEFNTKFSRYMCSPRISLCSPVFTKEEFVFACDHQKSFV